MEGTDLYYQDTTTDKFFADYGFPAVPTTAPVTRHHNISAASNNTRRALTGSEEEVPMSNPTSSQRRRLVTVVNGFNMSTVLSSAPTGGQKNSDGSITIGNNQGTLFSCRGSSYTYTVPAGTSYLSVTVAGAAGGGNANAKGGNGAIMNSIISVTPGQVLYMYPGCQSPWNGGGIAIACTPPTLISTYCVNHFNGGDSSDIRTSAVTPTVGSGPRIIVAGGGGGSADTIFYVGTDMKCLNGQNADFGSGTGNAVPVPKNKCIGVYYSAYTQYGAGGSQTSGGAGSNAGSLFYGGNSGQVNYYAGGGGGYYGGGAGEYGGGGSSHCGPSCVANTLAFSSTGNSGDGWIVVAMLPYLSPNLSSHK